MVPLGSDVPVRRPPLSRRPPARRWRGLAACCLGLALLATGGSLPAAGARPVVSLSAQERAWIRAHPKVVLAIDAGNAPMNFRDSQGTVSGVLIDYLAVLAQRTGLSIEYRASDWSTALGRALRHEVDGVVNADEREDRKTYLSFTQPLLVVPQAVVVPKNAATLTSLRDLAARRVAVVRDTVRVPILRRECPDCVVQPVRDLSEGFDLLNTQQVDALFDDLPVVQRQIESGLYGSLRVGLLYRSRETGFARLGLRNDRPELVAIFDRAIASLTEEDHRTIIRRWLGGAATAPEQRDLDLTPAERAWLTEHRDLTVGSARDWPPLEYWNPATRAYEGMAVDYLRALAADVGLRLRFAPPAPWTEIQAKGLRHEIDVLGAVAPTPARGTALLFTQPFLRLQVVLFGHDAMPLVPSVESAHERTFGAVSGFAVGDWLKRQHPGLRVREYASVRDVIRALSRREIDLFAGTFLETGSCLRELGVTTIKAVGETPYRLDLCVGVRRDQPVLASILNKAIQAAPPGRVDDLLSRYTPLRVEQVPRVDWQRVLRVTVPLLLALVSALTWALVARSLALRQWHRSEQRYQELTQHADSIILRMDRLGRVTFVNEYAERFFGYARDEIIGRSVVGTIVPERSTTDDDLGAMIANICRLPSQFAHNENENMRRNGERVWVAWTNHPVVDSRGEVTEVLCIGNDVTSQRQAAAALRDSEHRYRALFEAALDAILLLSDQRCVDCNPRALTLFGGSREQLLGARLASLLLDESVVTGRLGELVAAVRQGESQSFSCRALRLDGAAFDADVQLSPVTISGEPHVLAWVRDMTEHNRREREHATLQAELLQAQKMESVGRLAGGVAHDFNNMLTVIIGDTEVALSETQPESRLRALLMDILGAAERSSDLTRQLLAFARKQPVRPRVLDLNGTVEGMLRMLRRLIGEDIELVWKPGPRLHAICMDPIQLDQILANLVVNARDAITETGVVTIETHQVDHGEVALRHPGLADGEYVVLQIADNGTGMDEATQAQLFEPFFTTKETGKGTGLGLATVYGIVQQNHGFIDVTSEPGHGTLFRIGLPAVADGAVAAEELAEDTLRGSATVLLVEDEAAILSLGKAGLERQGYAVLTAQSPSEAIALVHRHTGPIDLLVTDVVMPGMNGRQLADHLVQLRPELRVLYVSGYPADAIAHRGVLDPGVQFLQKPFTARDLARKVQQALKSPAGE